MSRDPKKRAYVVGRGKPPAHTRFRPGQSGNPRGRPKGSKNLHTLLNAALDVRVEVMGNDGSRMYSKRELIVLQLVNKAVAGDIRHTTLVFKQLVEPSRETDGQSAEPIHGGKDDEQLLADMLAQLGLSRDEPEDDQ